MPDQQYLICHTNPNRTSGAAQVTISAPSKYKAIEQFEKDYPQRVITQIGIKGEEN